MKKKKTTRTKTVKNTTINTGLYRCAVKMMNLWHFDDYSEFVASLVRKEWERLVRGEPPRRTP